MTDAPARTVRPARPDDVDAIVALVHELAVYEREPDACRLTATQLARALFAPAPALFAHVVDDGGEVAGMALWFLNFSTWEGVHGVYVEDLYVTPDRRGHGLGRALLAALAGECRARGYARLELSVLDWNTPAVDFYRRLGGAAMDGWTVQRFTGDALDALAR